MKNIIAFVVALLTLSVPALADFSVDLVAAGGSANSAFDAGDVDISYDGTNLTVRITVDDLWELVETHVHVAVSVNDIPQKNGNPIPGKFEYSYHDPEATTVTPEVHEYTIPYSPTAETVIAVHASIEWWEEITEYPYFILHEETGWGDGEDFSGRNWAMYIEYVIEQISNDDCDNAESVGDVVNMPFDTTTATFDGPGLCMTSPNIWYCYTATCTGNVTVSLAGSSYDTMLAAYDGCECYPTAYIECNDDFEWPDLYSQITFFATEGNQYLIEIGGFSDNTGEGLLSISCEEVPCVDPESVSDVVNMPFDTTAATFDGLGLCMTSPNIWYCYTATCSGNVTVSLAGSSYDTMLAVYDGCECYPTEIDRIDCNDDFDGTYQSQITFTATEGNQYLIEVGGFAYETGLGLLSISCE